MFFIKILISQKQLMKKVHLLHNPTAGDNDFSKKELVKLIEKENFECIYNSVKEDDWDVFENDVEFLIIAGGDGTVRRVAKSLMKRKRIEKHFPLALLPHGTANNISCSLEVDGPIREIVRSWHKSELKKFDIGKVRGMKEDLFFLEGFGYGVFPKLIKTMSKMEEDPEADVNEKIRAARTVLLDIVQNYKARECTIKADGKDYSGMYIMVELLNIRSIGPNLVLAPSADPGDGELDMVLVYEKDRGKLETYLTNMINGETKPYKFNTVRAKSFEILWEGKDLHVDDERIKLDDPIEIRIDIQPDMLDFMVMAKK